MSTAAERVAAMVARRIVEHGELVTLRGQTVAVNSRTTAVTPTNTEYSVKALRGRGSGTQGSGARAESAMFSVILSQVGATPTTAWQVVDAGGNTWRVVDTPTRCNGLVMDLMCQRGK